MPEARFNKLESLKGWSWNAHESSWNEGYDQLSEFIKVHGHGSPAGSYITNDGYKLGAWVSKQRDKKNPPTQSQVQRLNELPSWTWDPQSDKWEEGYSNLLKYLKEHGDCLVTEPYKTPAGYPLGGWVKYQRKKKNELSIDRLSRINLIKGWSWDPNSDKWEATFLKLVEYQKQFGNCLVPKEYRTSDGTNLGGWVSVLRVERNKLPQEKKARLEQIDGWVWDTNEYLWRQGFNRLKEFMDQEGCAPNVDYICPDGLNLGNWVKYQRTTKKLLSQSRIDELESLKFWSWDPKSDRWNEVFNQLKKYADENGTSKLPRNYKSEDGTNLTSWATHQKRRRELLSAENRAKLESLAGWMWSRDG
jgi:hypothetical protein